MFKEYGLKMISMRLVEGLDRLINENNYKEFFACNMLFTESNVSKSRNTKIRRESCEIIV